MCWRPPKCYLHRTHLNKTILRWALGLIAFAFYSNCTAQPGDTSFYRSERNNLYWKNRIPVEGYWQQDVHYTIKAEVDDLLDVIAGQEQLTYWNNSPDTLSFVYFHLYQNAFQPGSYLDQLTKANGITPEYQRWEKENKGIVIEKIESEKRTLDTELDNTILKVILHRPLPPGQSLKFEIDFKTYYGGGTVRRRLKFFSSWGHKHYNGANWYPKISAYDRKFGWTADQHLNREFYGDYGSFDVELTFPNIYIVEATGILVNEKEVLPDSLRKKIDLANFKDHPWGFPPSLPVMPDSTKKTWKFHADNVHDFAFTADPTYRIGEVELNGIRCIALAQESHASKWQNAAAYAARLIEIYSNDIGDYAWPKIIVSDAGDGMEFPMLTLDGGSDPGYRALLAHEIGHQWFYGMVGNNETYRAFLDEGFTQFIQSWALEKLEGRYGLNEKSRSKYSNRFRDTITVPFRIVQHNYLREAIEGKDVPLNTHSDHFQGALAHGGGYSGVYRKAGTMLYNLQYVLGDSLFHSAFRHYFNQWKFCHPYPEDFRNSFIEFTRADLNWFFDEWLETNYRIDYAIRSVRAGKGKDDFEITFKRKERMEMPLDFSVFANDGKTYNYHIPNRNFIKQTGSVVLPKWYGWDKLNPTYKANIHIPSGIERIAIDTSFLLADINLLNNNRPLPVRIRFDSRITSTADWNNYSVRWRPEVWFNNYDGIKLGIHLEGDYFNYSRFFDFNFWLNSGLAQQPTFENADINKNDPLSFTFHFRTPAEKLFRGSTFFINTKMLDGLQHFSGGMDWTGPNKKGNVSVSYASNFRKNISALSYLLYPDQWGLGSYDNVVKVGLQRHFTYPHGDDLLRLSLRSSSIGSDYSYSYINFSVTDNYYFAKFTLRSRLIFQYGTGDDFAKESSLFLAGANGEELMPDKFTRSRAFIPGKWLGYGSETSHFHHGGGLNLRGYSGYLAPENAGDGTSRFIYRGTSGFAFNEELDFTRYLPLRPRLARKWLAMNIYLFGDAGSINYDLPEEKLAFSRLRADAGIGITATIKKFFSLQTIKPFTIRFDCPLWLNRPPAKEDYIQFRYVVGIGRSF